MLIKDIFLIVKFCFVSLTLEIKIMPPSSLMDEGCWSRVSPCGWLPFKLLREAIWGMKQQDQSPVGFYFICPYSLLNTRQLIWTKHPTFLSDPDLILITEILELIDNDNWWGDYFDGNK